MGSGLQTCISVIKRKLKLRRHREIPESRDLIKEITYDEVIDIVKG